MKKNMIKMDKGLFIAFTILALFGSVMIYSASSITTIHRYEEATYYFFIKQLAFILVMYIIGFLVVLKYPTKKYAKYRVFLISGGVFSLIGLFIYGSVTNSAQSWYKIPFFTIQPSEFAKSIIIIVSSIYYSMISRYKNQNLKRYLMVLAYGLFCAILIYEQPDLGSCIITAGISIMLFISTPYVGKNMIKVIGISSIILVVLSTIVFTFKDTFLTPNQLSRFNFLSPCSRIDDQTGYQVCNGYIAINEGGLTGVGFGESTQKYLYLPESHTDFIYPIIIEETGFIVGVIVLIFYAFILYKVLQIAKSAHNLRNSMLAYGTFWFIGLHIIVNLGGVLGLMPLTGVPLPLLSYGGSSTMNFLLMLFITLRVSIENKEDEYKETMKKLKRPQ